MNKEDKSNNKKKIPQGLYMAFKSNQGKTESKMRMEKANLIDVSNGIIWCEIIKEKLLEQYKKMINMHMEESKREENK